MAKWCEACGGQTADEANFCSSCGGTTFRPVEAPGGELTAEPAVPAPKKRRRGRWIALAVVVVLVAAGVAAFLLTRDSTSNKEEAVALCRDDVLDQLKNPAAAKFVNIDAGDEPADAEAFLVGGSVDSTNGFGATVRDEWTCIVGIIDGKWNAVAVFL